MDFVPQNVHWLIPEDNVPCDVFLHFRGCYALGISVGQPASLAFFEKLAKADYSYVYVRQTELGAWEQWLQRRHPSSEQKEISKRDDSEQLYGNKRAELITYLQKIISPRSEGDKFLNHAFERALRLTKNVTAHPMLDWYFQQFHEPPDLFHHGSRVAFPLAIFSLANALGTEKEVESVVFSAIIHELSGNPRESLKTVVSQQTLAELESNRHPVPKEVIELIRLHDELISGKGFPNNIKGEKIPPLIRAFALFNHFDHYRLGASGTRRTRFEQAKQKMTSRKTDYDSVLWEKFWYFWEHSVEAIS